MPPGFSLARILFPYGAKRRVLRGPARGMSFIVHPGMALSYALGTHDAAPRSFSRWLSEGDTVYDVGANQGQMSIIFSALVGRSGHVLAFEPSLPEHEKLLRNISINNLSNLSTLRLALAGDDGDAWFEYSPLFPSQGKLSTVEPSYSVPGATKSLVPAATLDSLIGKHPPPDLIKIDVEGAGADVLRGGRATLRQFGPAVYIELHGPEEQLSVRDELLSIGYVAETVSGKRVNDPASEWHSQLYCFLPTV